MDEIAFARALRRDATTAERLLWAALRRRQRHGFKFRRQVPLGPYFADFASFEARVIVEVDGGQHCEAPRDAARDAWFARAGWEVMRYWNPDVLANLAGVVTDLDERLRDRRPTGSRRVPADR